MFSGMPGYQIAMDAPALSPQYLVYSILTLHLPDPANFFFLGCICFYILAMALRVNPWAGIIGALGYAYTTYNPTALVVGHETKIQAIQIMPAFLAGLLLIFEKRYWIGTATFALFTALLIAANHPQISYYAGIIAIGLACNAAVTFTTLDYAKASLRDGSVLATPGGSVTTTGSSQDYALSYSMYKTEAFELLVPKIRVSRSSICSTPNIFYWPQRTAAAIPSPSTPMRTGPPGSSKPSAPNPRPAPSWTPLRISIPKTLPAVFRQYAGLYSACRRRHYLSHKQ